MEERPVQRKRIGWIDSVKGIAIILTIMGHTYLYGSLARNIIFSFHMPLFFFLSGITFHYGETKTEIIKRIKKDAIHLLIPVVAVTGVSTCIQLAYTGFTNNTTAFAIVRQNLDALLWASAVPIGNHPGLGMLWFLVSLFTARTIIRFVHYSREESGGNILAIALSGIGFLLILANVRLPLNFEVSLTAILFIISGIIYKNCIFYKENKLLPVFYTFALLFWLYCISNGIYSEMGTRSWPGDVWKSVVEAECGILMVVIFVQKLSEGRKILLPFEAIGRHTLLILCVHNFDSFPFIQQCWNHGNIWTASTLRVLVVLAISGGIYLLRRAFQKVFISTNRQKCK